jgi:DNA-binding IclR family transcriptional regulator
MTPDKPATAGAQTLDRGVRLLWHLAERPDGETLTELSHGLGVNRTAVHRMLETFLAHGLVRRDEDKKFHLSYGLVQLASAVDMDLRGAAYPILAALADSTMATCNLMVPISEDEVQAVLVVAPRMAPVHLAFRTGQRHPIGRGSGGIAVLAGRPPSRDDSAQVVEARRLGYAVSHEQVIPGVTGVSAPVDAPPGQEASVGVSLVGNNGVETVAAAVMKAARELGEELAARSTRVQ